MGRLQFSLGVQSARVSSDLGKPRTCPKEPTAGGSSCIPYLLSLLTLINQHHRCNLQYCKICYASPALLPPPQHAVILYDTIVLFAPHKPRTGVGVLLSELAIDSELLTGSNAGNVISQARFSAMPITNIVPLHGVGAIADYRTNTSLSASSFFLSEQPLLSPTKVTPLTCVLFRRRRRPWYLHTTAAVDAMH